MCNRITTIINEVTLVRLIWNVVISHKDTHTHKQTHTHTHSQAIFEYFPYPLLKVFLLSIPANTIWDYFTSGVKPTALGNSIEEKCWTPPLPFCPNTSTSTTKIVQDAIKQVKNHIQNIDHMHAKTSIISVYNTQFCSHDFILLYSG